MSIDIKIKYNRSKVWIQFGLSLIAFCGIAFLLYTHDFQKKSYVVVTDNLVYNPVEENYKFQVVETVSFNQQNIANFYTCILYIMLIFSFFGFIFSARKLFNPQIYGIIASQKGLRVDTFGLLPWDSIENIYCDTISSNEFLIIKFCNVNFVTTQKLYFLKLYMFLSGHYGRNSIFLNHYELDNQTLAAKLHDFMVLRKQQL